MDSYDAILVGGGHNALVAAIYLARAGWRTLVLEQSERLGGAVMSAEVTLPGFVHDLFATNQNTFYGGLVYGELGKELERHGVRAQPAQIRGDAAGEIRARDWTEAAEPYADRVIAKLSEYAPGIERLILKRAILTPADLEAHDPNLVGGDSVAGSHHLRQNFIFRPLPGFSSYRTPIEGLFMTGAATWPDGGVTGLSGYLAARAVLAPHGLRARVSSLKRLLPSDLRAWSSR